MNTAPDEAVSASLQSTTKALRSRRQREGSCPYLHRLLSVLLEAGPICSPLQTQTTSIREIRWSAWGHRAWRPEPGFTTRSSQRWHLHSFQHTARPHSMIWGHTLSRVFRDHPSPKLHWGNVVLQRRVIYPQWLRRYQQNRSWNVTLWPPGQALGALHPHFLRLSLKGQRTSNK